MWETLHPFPEQTEEEEEREDEQGKGEEGRGGERELAFRILVSGKHFRL